VNGLRERKWLDVRGLSVTIPHKQNALRYVEAVGGDVEPLARKIGAVNTLTIDAGGQVSGHNTDYAAALDALTEAAGVGRGDLGDVPVSVVGAGGVSRAIVAGLTDVGARVTIYNRTFAKAEALAGQFACTARSLGELQRLDAKVVINCTSIGMHPRVGETPVPAGLLKKDMVVFDTVYNPLETRLLREARELGATVVDGVRMFVNQAAAQFSLFCGLDAPRDVMRRVVLSRLEAGERDGSE